MPRLEKGPRTPLGSTPSPYQGNHGRRRRRGSSSPIFEIRSLQQRTPPSAWKPLLSRVPNPFLDYELLALSTSGATYRIQQGSPVLIPLGSLPPLSPDSQAKVGAPQDHPPYCSPTASTSKRCNYPEPSPSGPRPERLPDPPNPRSPYLDLSPGNPFWFDSPVKASEKPRVGLNSAEKRSASLKRRAECPFVDTSSLLSARPSRVLLISNASESDEDDPSLSPQEAQVTTSDTSDSPPRPPRRIVVRPLRRRRPIILLITSDHKIQ